VLLVGFYSLLSSLMHGTMNLKFKTQDRIITVWPTEQFKISTIDSYLRNIEQEGISQKWSSEDGTVAVLYAMKCNLLTPEFYISILAHPVSKIWIIQKQKKVALWNILHFEKKNWKCAACLKYSVLIFVEKIYKMQHLEVSGTPVLYIGRAVLKG
jgi:hypothetical protein